MPNGVEYRVRVGGEAAEIGDGEAGEGRCAGLPGMGDTWDG